MSSSSTSSLLVKSAIQPLTFLSTDSQLLNTPGRRLDRKPAVHAKQRRQPPTAAQDEEAGRIRLEEDVEVDARGRPVLAIVTGDELPAPPEEQSHVPLRTWNICGGGMAF
ncbi:hypothetical protein QFC20_002630 [Naganishia adeliensis]|uniref:Uncharacterized protein n=1 Tax=Naganishia adeliensis TaxID=92952 RepID=A0ACC2WHV7_9TREE|nr:hypothetical protein QFC20_002630 [Naganishia adeliensis]